jgi:tripartite-type tricarboxylate transporter receptor subunit TctC
MQADMAHSINTAETLQFLQGIGFIASMNTPTAFSEVIRNDMARWGKLIKTLAR